METWEVPCQSVGSRQLHHEVLQHGFPYPTCIAWSPEMGWSPRSIGSPNCWRVGGLVEFFGLVLLWWTTKYPNDETTPFIHFTFVPNYTYKNHMVSFGGWMWRGPWTLNSEMTFRCSSRAMRLLCTFPWCGWWAPSWRVWWPPQLGETWGFNGCLMG